MGGVLCAKVLTLTLKLGPVPTTVRSSWDDCQVVAEQLYGI